MIETKYKMMRYMQAEQLAESTINLYSSVYEKLKKDVGEVENKSQFFWVEYLANIVDPVYRNNVRSVILKVCRDVLGQRLILPTVNRPFLFS